MTKILCLLGLVVVVVSGQGYHEGYDKHEEYAEPHYSFSYEVHDPHTGDYKSQREERKGDHTQGEYSLVEPDGSKRTVQYKVEGKSGFIADVHREQGKGGYGEPNYASSYKPNYESSYKPSYESSYKPSYESSYKQSYKPSYESSYKPSYESSYKQSYEPSYKPSYESSYKQSYEPSYKPNYESNYKQSYP